MSDRPAETLVMERQHIGADPPPRGPATLLVGDVGHTKILLALYRWDGEGWQALRVESSSSVDCTGLEAVIARFLGTEPVAIDAACFGVAGPVLDRRCRPTDLTWEVTTDSLCALLRTPRVILVNDLAALGHSLEWLSSEQLLTLQTGVERPGNRVVLAAGTGLGECTLFWDGTRHHPSACEGGHSDFGPCDEWEAGLWRFLGRRYGGHVSWARVVSGAGILNIFDFVVESGTSPAPQIQAARALALDPVPSIVAAGLVGSCPASAAALARFPGLYGAEAGNLALKSLAVGGVYLGGGLTPRMPSLLGDGRLLDRFLDKGRFRGLLQQVPVHLILEPRAGLLGALRRAALLLTTG